MKDKRKPSGYWREWEHVQLELDQIIENLKHFPSQSELDSMEKGSLRTAIVSYYGGFQKVRRLFGYALPRRKSKLKRTARGYWKDWGNIEKVLAEMTHSLGHFPTTLDMRRLGSPGLPNALYDYHGGLNSVKERLSNKLDIPLERDQLETLLLRYVEQ